MIDPLALLSVIGASAISAGVCGYCYGRAATESEMTRIKSHLVDLLNKSKRVRDPRTGRFRSAKTATTEQLRREVAGA